MTIDLEFSDLGAIGRLGLQGKGVASWLSEQGIPVPGSVLSVERISDQGLIARTGAQEYFLESADGDFISGMQSRLPAAGEPVYQVPRDEASWLLRGQLAPEAMTQTCAVDLHSEATGRLIYTRVAGVSCAILSKEAEVPTYQIWLDRSYAHYLFSTIAGIVKEMSGTVIEGAPGQSAAESH